MNLVDPVSSGKYCGMCVSTAPAVEPAVMSFTVSLTGCTIDAIAAVVSTCSASTNCTDSLVFTCCGSVCIAMPCGGGSFTPDAAYDSLWDSVKPLTGEYTINFFQYQEDVGGVHAECLDQLHRLFLRRQLHLLPVHVAGLCRSEQWEVYLYGFFPVQIDGQCRSEKWEVYLYGDFPSWWTVVVWKCCPGVCLRLGFHPIGNGSHHLWVVPPSERGTGMSMPSWRDELG